MPAFHHLLYDVEDHVATITLNRPGKLNALTDDVFDELFRALDTVDADDDVRALIITGAGRGFCAGRDLSAGAPRPSPTRPATRTATSAAAWRCGSSDASSR